MGKPFKKELSLLNGTYDWAKNVDLQLSDEDIEELISTPTFAVGSGGSFSTCHMFSILHRMRGGFSKAVTPLELHYSRPAIRNSNVVFLSASGKNSDILFAYQSAIKNDPLRILGLCMKEGTPLFNLAKNHAISKVIEYSSPAGKDGFLATNSLIAYFTILSRMFGFTQSVNQFEDYERHSESLDQFVNQLDVNFTITVLYGGWSQPVAVDIESKFTEAGLGNVLLSDYRNFGHGRHNWFDKKKQQSAIVALVTPSEKRLAEKTLSFLPKYIPILNIITKFDDNLAALDLLIQSFQLANAVGEKIGIDPGRPGVPSYGSKLYNLRYHSIIDSDKQDNRIKNAILKKARKKAFENLNESEKLFWEKSLNGFRTKVNERKFGSLILDYDGTVCTKDERKSLPSAPIIEIINIYLNKGFTLGIATGRGKSIRETLQKFIPKEYWNSVIIGYYNCADISLLGDDGRPTTNQKPKKSLQRIYNALSQHAFVSGQPTLTLRPFQLTIERAEGSDWILARTIALEIMAKYQFGDIQILESGHSIDVIAKPEVSKINIIEHCVQLSKEKGLAENYLCIGDKGQYPGNDYELLMTDVSLSVDEVSSDPLTCWNLSEPGNRGASTLLQYLQSLSYHKNHFTIAI